MDSSSHLKRSREDDDGGGDPRRMRTSYGGEDGGRGRGGGGGYRGDRGGGGGYRGDRGGGGRGGGRGDGGRGGRGGRGGGRGRGRGRGRGGSVREPRPEPPLEVQHDLVKSRPTLLLSKVGRAEGSEAAPAILPLVTNYFKLNKLATEWSLYQYRIDFVPDDERPFIRKQLISAQRNELPPYIFDGSMLFTAQKFEHKSLFSEINETQGGTKKYEVVFKFIKELPPGDATYLQFYNIVLRECLRKLQMEELGRHFYDPTAEIRIDQHKLVLWPGVVTAMRNHENNVLLCVEITHKVLRNDSVLQVIKAIQDRGGNSNHVKSELLNSIVLTVYNRKTYKVDDIDFRQTPMSTFNMRGEKVSYADYYFKSYGLRVEDPHQPLLISRPKKKDVHRGPPGKKPQPILLIPEFCRMTGLSNEMRANFNLMRDLNQHLHKPPEGRIETINTFMGRLCAHEEVKEELSKWQLNFTRKMETVEGKVLPQEDIKFGNTQVYRCDESGDFTKALRDMKMYTVVTLERWIIIVPQRDMGGVENFARLIHQVSGQAGFVVKKPLQIFQTSDPRTMSYMKCVEEAFAIHKELQLVFVVLPNYKPLDTYSAIKKRLCCEYGIASQCVIGKNVSNPKGGMSIATKIAFQMSAKIGAEPWSISIPLKTLMVIGFDVFHSANKKNPSVGAMVASTSPTFAKYFSTVSCHQGREQLSANMSQDVTKCLHAYKTKNQRLPDRIIMYRDGVGDGQLTFVFETEIGQIRTSIENAYRACEQPMPKFSFIVVTKKIRTRLMTSGAPERNPPPGTVVDDVITLPERFDFFLISQHAMQGTVSPTNYNVLVDEQGFSVYKLQRLTFKLTHLYFNWSGTVSVPAACQYAKKLAYLTGQCLQGQPSDSLSHQLYYL